jgi:2-C-methyl-D-erythritol 4-phosphate cytidylyltransferase
MNAAILVAAGTSSRMGFDKPTAPLAGIPLIAHSLRAIQSCPDIAVAVLVCSPERVQEFTELAAPYPKFQHIVPGGAQRGTSVLHGLQALATASPLLVAVHDAARPLATPALFSSVLTAANTHGAASAAQPVADSLHRTDASGALHQTISRANLFAMQTPQAARADILLSALLAHHATATDEVSALIAEGVHPLPVIHDSPNFKITYPQDLVLAEALATTHSL